MEAGPAAVMETLINLQQVAAEEQDQQAFYREASRAAGACIGHKLCTFLLFDAETMEVERLFSSNPEAYPVRGRKKMQNTPWGQLVLKEGQPYIGRNADDIRQYFSDYEIILGLGLRSILNMPIRRGGMTLGTMNLLNGEAFYSEDHLPIARLLAGLMAARLF